MKLAVISNIEDLDLPSSDLESDYCIIILFIATIIYYIFKF